MPLTGLPMGDIPDSELLPDPAGDMYEFYEGLDTNLFSESTGINHNAATKWLRTEILRHLEFLSYLLSVKDHQAIMSDDIVHTEAIIDDNVTINKLAPELRDFLNSIRPENVIERNSVQTFNCMSVFDNKISITNGAIISQANGFTAVGQNDLVEVLTNVNIVPTTGPIEKAYLYKTVGGAYFQSPTKLDILNIETMVGNRVFLGTFTVNSSNEVTAVVPAIPTVKFRNIEEPSFSGQYVIMPSGTTAQRPTLSGTQKAIRYNESIQSWESWNGSFWGDLGSGQLLGNAPKKAVQFLSNTISEALVIPTGCNGFSIGSVTLADGASITIPDGSVYKIL